MSYEYSAASGRFEIDNPYRIENLALLACGAVSSVAGLYLLIRYRGSMGSGEVSGLRAIVVGLLLLAAGLGAFARASMQLRYFFGRGRPHDLTNLEATNGDAPDKRAAWLKENLRQNALVYREPQGAISGLVHYLLKTLIFAPRLIRAAAEAQCFNALLTAAILLGMLATSLFYADTATSSWIGLVYLAVLIPKLLRPFGRGATTYARARAGIGFIIFIVAIPILGPPLLGHVLASLPDISGFHFPRTVIVCLLTALIAQALFFLALLKQFRERPSINMACEQRALSLNGNPAKLFEELERTLQTRWTETIPNRRYAFVKLPEILAAQSGSFSGEVLEETQPVPTTTASAGSIAEQLSLAAARPIAALTGLGAVTFTSAVVTALFFATHSVGSQQAWSTAFLGATLLFTALYCLRSANLLWGRVDFQSVLLWIEVNGSFEEAQINIGNQFTSAMSSSKKVINVESMTLRVWAAELDSVILQKDGPRDLIGMRGRPDMAKLYADHLETFAGQIANVVAPGSSADRSRIGTITQTQQHLSGSTLGAAPTGQSSPSMLTGTPAPVRRMCPNEQCAAELPIAAAFCSACGTRVRA